MAVHGVGGLKGNMDAAGLSIVVYFITALFVAAIRCGHVGIVRLRVWPVKIH